MSSADKMYETGKTQVPGQLLGYGLQYTRMLSLLLVADEGSTVSLEVFEDVGVQDSNSALASQTKSSTTKNNPVSNRAEPLWKTLRNWIDAIKNGQLPASSTLFELYVFGDFDGEICKLFSEAKSETEAIAAISKAREILAADSKQLPDFIETVLKEDKVLPSLIKQFRYKHGSGASVEDLKKQLSRALVPPEFLDKVLTHAVGWVKCEVDQLLEKSKLAAIAVTAFRAEIMAYVRSLIFSAVLADLAGPPLPAGLDLDANRSRIYVRQLDLICVSEDRKLGAVSAYLRSSVNRSEWARRALVHEHSLDDFEQRLTDYWKNSRTQYDISLKDTSAIER